jgi:hypothetical protein
VSELNYLGGDVGEVLERVSVSSYVLDMSGVIMAKPGGARPARLDGRADGRRALGVHSRLEAVALARRGL